MRSLVITQNVTADGAVEMLDDWFDPMAQDADMLEINHRDSALCDTLVLGRQTFEDFRGFWPEQTDDPTGITNELDLLDKFVVSRTMTDPRWQNSTVLSGDPVSSVRELLSRPGDAEVLVTGSITLCRTGVTYTHWTTAEAGS